MEKSKTYLRRSDTIDGVVGGISYSTLLLGCMAIFCMGFDWYHQMVPKILFWITCVGWLLRPNISLIVILMEGLERHTMPPKMGRTAMVVWQSIFIILMILIIYFENYTLH